MTQVCIYIYIYIYIYIRHRLLRAGRVEVFCCLPFTVNCFLWKLSLRGSQTSCAAIARPCASVDPTSQDAIFPVHEPLKSAAPCLRRPKTLLDAPKPRPRAAQEHPRAPQDAPGPRKSHEKGIKQRPRSSSHGYLC